MTIRNLNFCDIWTQSQFKLWNFTYTLTVVIWGTNLFLYTTYIFAYGGIYWSLRVGVGEIGHKTILLVKNVDQHPQDTIIKIGKRSHAKHYGMNQTADLLPRAPDAGVSSKCPSLYLWKNKCIYCKFDMSISQMRKFYIRKACVYLIMRDTNRFY